MRCRWRPAITRRASRRRRSGWRACAAIMRRCGGSSSRRIFASSRRRSRRIGQNWPSALKPYDGLYAPEDFLWSALRPLPRGWVPVGGSVAAGRHGVLGRDAGDRRRTLRAGDWTGRRRCWRPGIAVYRIEPGMFDRLRWRIAELSFLRFWQGQALPSSPFRRAYPARVSCQCEVRLSLRAEAVQSPSRCAPRWRLPRRSRS